MAHLKDAGLGVGVVVLVDAGGIEHAARHLAATADLVNALPLGPGDLVSLLDANEVRDRRLDPTALGFTPLTGPRWAEQQAELKRLLLPVRTRTEGQGRALQPGEAGRMNTGRVDIYAERDAYHEPSITLACGSARGGDR